MGRTTKLVRRLASRFRRARYARVVAALRVRPGDRIIELGCGRGVHSIARYNATNEILGVDLLPPSRISVRQPNFEYLQADAADLSAIPDDAFDVAVSFGMLEHIQPEATLRAAIREAQRVAGRYCFVVPHRHAIIEPHFLLPLFPLWPDRAKTFAIRHLTFGSLGRSAAGERQRIHWLSRDRWRELFDDPELRILDHWYGPLLLDYLIVGGRDRSTR